MRKPIARLPILVLMLACTFSSVADETTPKPLRRAQLLALVSGNVLDTTITAEIRHRALAFSPSDAYVSLLKQAGADSKVLDAVRKAKTNSVEGPTTPQDSLLLQHLAKAGSLAKSGQNDEAAAEIAAVLAENSDSYKLDAGFVAAKILIDQDRTEEAGSVLSRIASQDPTYPAVEMRLSHVAWSLEEVDECLRHARAAIAANPDDAVAHENAATALTAMHKFDAAKIEYEQSIIANPDRGLVYEKLADLLTDLGDWDAAIAQYKKALTYKPGDANLHYNLGFVYDKKHDDEAAIREYREAKRLDPQRIDARQNLAGVLMHREPAAAIAELRELAVMAPNFSLCHLCLGNAYTRLSEFDNAIKEYRLAASLDPSSPDPYLGVAHVEESQKKHDAALQDFRRAQIVDPTSSAAFEGAGRMLFEKGEYRAAAAEMERAEKLDPANWYLYNLRGLELAAAGDSLAAIAEFHQSLALDPKQVEPRLGLAAGLEKTGEWVAALTEYRRAAADEPPPVLDVPRFKYDSQKKYEQAQERFKAHLADLKVAGKSIQADKLEADWRAKESMADPDEKYHAALQAGQQAMKENRLDEAETFSKEAIAIAEKIQPMDGRLPEALGQLGYVYGRLADYAKASDAFHRQYALTQQIYGSESTMNTQALHNLTLLYVSEKDFPEAEKHVQTALSINEKAYGEEADAVGDVLRQVAGVYSQEKKYDKAESALQRSLHIFEITRDDLQLSFSLNMLCYVYDQSSQFEKSQSCHGRMVSLLEKKFGVNSVYLVQDLSAQANALRQLGRNDEAVKLEQRAKTLQLTGAPQAAVQPQN